MKNHHALQARDRRMLELLAEGASARVVARKMHYSEGTVRVYLHNLYKTIGVRNKTEAVLWQVNRLHSAQSRGEAAAPDAEAFHAEECFGDTALREGLLASLGVMETFLGPYGRIWEVALKLKGAAIEPAMVQRRARARRLWRALLRSDFAYGKHLHDEGEAERLPYEDPSEALLLLSLLLVGGYSTAAERVMNKVVPRRKSGQGMSTREAGFLRVLRDAASGNSDASLVPLYHAAADNANGPVVKQAAMVALFHLYKARKDAERARATANALWAEAESARRQLEAMGVRPLPREAAVCHPAKPAPRAAVVGRDRVAAGR